MMDAKYVLCRWKKRLWPAKVLTRTETSTKHKRKKEFFLNVQIFSLDKKIKVKSTEVETLKKSRIEDIASLLASQDEVPAAPVEELTYRRSLRVALDVLNERTCSRQESSPKEESAALSPSEKPPELASSPCEPDSSAPLHGDGAGSLGLGRREHQRPLGPSAGGRDPTCRTDREKGRGKSGIPRALPVSPAEDGSRDGSGSRTHRKNWTAPSKRGRTSVQEPDLCQTGPPLPEGGGKAERERRAGRSAAPRQPSRAEAEDGEEDLGSKGEGFGLALPSDGSTVPMACPEARCHPAKRLCPNGRQRPRKPLKLRPATFPTQGPTGHLSAHHNPADGKNPSLPDPKKAGEAGPQCSGESAESNSINSILEEDEEDEEPPRILLYHEPRSFEVGMLVWLKYQKYPFWPAVVKSIRRRDKKASVLFIEGNMNPKGRGITVSLRRLKHFDCKEKQALLNEAKEAFDQAIGWCISLITDYRVRLGCGSFSGSFLEYYAADISNPVRKSIQRDVLGTRFPQLSTEDPEEPAEGSPWGRRQPCRKVLPDRSRAARDRANQKLVEYIVKNRGAESHLCAILKNRKPSRWLKTFLNSGQYVTCVETYLEDEEQLDLVVKYLQGIYREMGSRLLTRVNGDGIRFILDVLLPEAIICAISAVDAVDYQTAEQKYIKGPSVSYREKEIFDNQLLEERSRRC